jgi:hypothetical protein
MKCTKHPYSQARAFELKRRREHEVRGLELRPYYCIYCGYWHLTSQEYQENKKGKNL